MAKSKSELLDEAKALDLELTTKNTIAEINSAIESKSKTQEKPVKLNDEADAKLAKAGKRSAKAAKEAEEKQAKEERKSEAKIEESGKDPKPAEKPARSRLERRGKKFKKASEQIDRDKTYNLKEALDLAVKTSPVKFDASVELHMNLNVDPRQADQNIRGTVTLPGGTGKSLKIAVLADDNGITAAKKAKADKAGGDDLLAEIEKGQLDFDILIATPQMMPKLGKFAKVLGPKGLMPNPKSGTVTTDVAKAVEEAKAGRVEYRVDSTGIIHAAFGKCSFAPDKLEENAKALISAVKSAKPASIKGVYIKSVYLTTSMGPSISLSLTDI